MVQKVLLYGMPLSLFVTGFFFPIGVLLYWTTNNLWTLGQQFFILRKLPPVGSDAHKAKLAADKPVIDPKTLAPKPGAKPVRTKGGRPVPPSTTTDTAIDGTATGTGATGSTASGAGSSKRAGAAPARRRWRRRQRLGQGLRRAAAPPVARAAPAPPTVANASAADPPRRRLATSRRLRRPQTTGPAPAAAPNWRKPL